MKRKIQFFLFVSVLILLTQTNAFACKCIGEPDFNKMFSESDAVIKGKAVIVEIFGLEVFAFIEVEKSWKGISEDKVIIKTDTGSCGVEFETGKTYYLWVNKYKDSFVTMPCRDYGEKQIEFLQDKPTLELKASNSDFNINSNSSTKESNENEVTSKESDNIQDKSKSDNEIPDYASIFAISVPLLVFVFVAIIVGFFFWRNRKG